MCPVRVRRFLEAVGLIGLVVLAAACAAPAVQVPLSAEPRPAPAVADMKAGPAAPGGAVKAVSAPDDLFFRALVGPDDGVSGGDEALRLRLEAFVQAFPTNRWAAPARALIAALTRLQDCERLQDQERREREGDLAEKIRLIRDKDALREDLRLSQEKCQGELNRLNQDNDQLKKYIQRLRDLEIQLEKRERLLR